MDTAAAVRCSLRRTWKYYPAWRCANDGIFEDLVDLQSLSFDWHSGVIARLMDHPMLNRALTFINPALATLAPHG